jgi:hypothetical protein
MVDPVLPFECVVSRRIETTIPRRLRNDRPCVDYILPSTYVDLDVSAVPIDETSILVRRHEIGMKTADMTPRLSDDFLSQRFSKVIDDDFNSTAAK